MAEKMHSSALVPARIPRYIGNLNALPSNAGLVVEMTVKPYDDDPLIRLWSRWCGARDYGHNALISGDVIVSGNEVLFEIDFGAPDFTIADVAGVQIVSYVDETLYHGTPAALMALGIERSRLPLKKKGARHGRDIWAETEEWSSRRQPDGSIVHRVESPSALRRRRSEMISARKPETKARPSHLRLVIDNTRPEVPNGG